MACPDENLLAAFVDGGLAGDRRRLVDRHIDRCEACRIVISELARDQVDPDATQQSEPLDATSDHTATSVAITRTLHIVPGTLIGEYEVTERLGAGGMGVVFAAVHPRIGKRVAIKVLLHEHARDPQALARFENEARAVNAIGHKNIVDIFGFGELADRSPYCVMEYVTGDNLQTYLERRPALSLAQALAILRPIFDAVSAAHERSIVHRDLKPGNVMIAGSDAEPTIKVLDFGLAKILSDPSHELTDPGVAMGTPLFMSPEQFMGEKVDHRTDIYALGVMAYQMLCGCYPFPGTTPNTVRHGHFFIDPPPPSSRAAHLPSSVDEVLAKALAKDPAKRHATARELADALERCSSDPATTRAPDQIWPTQPAVAAMMSTLAHEQPPIAPVAVTPSVLEAPAYLAPTPARDASAVPTEASVGPRRRRRWWIAGVIAVVVLIVGGVMATSRDPDPTLPTTAPVVPATEPVARQPVITPIDPPEAKEVPPPQPTEATPTKPGTTVAPAPAPPPVRAAQHERPRTRVAPPTPRSQDKVKVKVAPATEEDDDKMLLENGKVRRP